MLLPGASCHLPELGNCGCMGIETTVAGQDLSVHVFLLVFYPANLSILYILLDSLEEGKDASSCHLVVDQVRAVLRSREVVDVRLGEINCSAVHPIGQIGPAGTVPRARPLHRPAREAATPIQKSSPCTLAPFFVRTTTFLLFLSSLSLSFIEQVGVAEHEVQHRVLVVVPRVRSLGGHRVRQIAVAPVDQRHRHFAVKVAVPF